MQFPGITTNSGRFVLAGCATVLLAVGAGACGGDDSSSLSEAAQRGKQAAAGSGCAGCHGVNGQGGVGPAWIDLAGSNVEIDVDGGGTTTVVADDAYLLRSILDPGAEEVAGYTLKMPGPVVNEEQALDIVAYIKELTSDPQN